MRFIHIADLHLGKRLNETDLSADIEHALFSEIFGRIYREAAEEAPDKPIEALVIAGDIYDKSLPSADAEEMFGRILNTAAGLGLKVYCTSGNHDSARRVAANEQLLSQLGIYIAREFSAESPVRVERLGDFDIAMLPFVALPDVRTAYPDDDIPDMTAAVELVLRRAGLPGERPCVLVAHQAASESGEGLLGAQQCVRGSVFSGFAYTALGHIHTPADVGERARYCGSPVCYSGSEAKNPQKYVDIVDVQPDGSCEVQHREIRPLHAFRIIEDSFERLMSEEYTATDDYCYITVSGFDGVVGVAQQLRTKFVNLLSLKYHSENGGEETDEEGFDEDGWSFGGEFERFCRKVTGSDPEPELMKSAEYIFELTERAFSGGRISELMQQQPELDGNSAGGDEDDN
ncbi:MAG: exonuclease SbcCD subunit D [Oscillospiraceae bacterium]